jgi:hypothetical protein
MIKKEGAPLFFYLKICIHITTQIERFKSWKSRIQVIKSNGIHSPILILSLRIYKYAMDIIIFFNLLYEYLPSYQYAKRAYETSPKG